MTLRDSGQDFDPKHRIVGAIVVVTLAVIFIPMILGEREPSVEPRGSQAAAPAAPGAEDTKVAVTKITAAVAPAASAPRSAAPGPAKPEPTTTPAAPTAKAPAPASAETRRSAGGWVVQVGTFANTANATRLEQKLRAEGEVVQTERITLAGGSAIRLRVGPFPDRAAALKAQERIRRDIGVKGVVLTYP